MSLNKKICPTVGPTVSPTVWLVFLLAFILVGAAGADTFLVDSLVTTAPEEMDMSERIRVISAETGVMDTLFDTGHIFFNNYILPDDSGAHPDTEKLLYFARGMDADYLLKMTVVENGASWSFLNVKSGAVLAESSNSLDEIPSRLKLRERWILLGGKICQSMLAVLP